MQTGNNFFKIFSKPVILILWYLVIHACNQHVVYSPKIEYLNLDKVSRVTVLLYLVKTTNKESITSILPFKSAFLIFLQMLQQIHNIIFYIEKITLIHFLVLNLCNCCWNFVNTKCSYDWITFFPWKLLGLVSSRGLRIISRILDTFFHVLVLPAPKTITR